MRPTVKLLLRTTNTALTSHPTGRALGGEFLFPRSAACFWSSTDNSETAGMENALSMNLSMSHACYDGMTVYAHNLSIMNKETSQHHDPALATLGSGKVRACPKCRSVPTEGA